MSIDLPADRPRRAAGRLERAPERGRAATASASQALDAEGLLDGGARADLRPLRAARRARRRRADGARLRRHRRAPVLRRPVRRRAAVGRRAPDAAVALLLPARRGQRRAARHRGRARGPGAVLEPRDRRPRRHRLRRLSDRRADGPRARQPVRDRRDAARLAGRRSSRRSPTSPRSSAASSSAATSCGAWRSTPARDALTGMANRRAWDDELPSALRSAERLGHPLTRRADRHRLLQGLQRPPRPSGRRRRAARDRRALARASTRDIDLLARIGGEEFGLVLPGCDADEALRRRRPPARRHAAGPDGLGRHRRLGAAADAPIRSSPRPTARCTAPSATGATASASSRRASLRLTALSRAAARRCRRAAAAAPGRRSRGERPWRMPMPLTTGR